MIVLLFFLVFWCGLSVKYIWYLFIPIAVIIIVLGFRKFGKVHLIISCSLFILGIGISHIYIDNKGNDFSGLVVESKENYFLILSKGEKLYVYQKEHGYEVGDFLTLKGDKTPLSFTRLESQFDFESYLNKKGVKYEVEVNKIGFQFQNPIRLNKNKKEFLSHFNEETRAVVSTLLFGNYEDSTVTNNLEVLHLSRLSSMSGFYIYVFLDLLSFLFSFLLKRKYKRLASILFLIPYVIFTYPRFAVIRIFCFELVKWANKNLLNNKFSTLDIIGSLGLLFLTIDPNLGSQISFIMGMTLNTLSSFLYQGHPEDTKPWKIKLISTGLMALILLPFELQFYNGINPLMIIEQYCLTPFMMLFSITSMLCFYKIPIYPVAEFFNEGIIKVTDFFRIFTFSIPAPEFHPFVLVIFIICFAAFLYYRQIRFFPIKNTLFTAMISMLTLQILPIGNFMTTSVSFINVGQGDSCLIRSANIAVLIDTGGAVYADIANDTLIPYLKKNRIYDLDLVITTHDDYDHSGALKELNRNFKIKNYVNDDDSFPITIGNITFTNYNNHVDELNEENEKSLVVGFSLSGKDYLIMGDASIEIEKNIMKEYKNVPCDIIKVGHHGSNTSTSKEFVGFVSPKEAIISVGKNYYGHPTSEVLNILKKAGVTIRRTDIEGTISYNNFIWI